MNRKPGFSVIVFAILGSIILFNGPAYAQGARGKAVGEPGMVWRLDLTKDQKTNIIAKEDAIEKETLPLKNSIKNNRDRLNVELSMDKPDNSKINSLIDNISKDMTDIQKKRISFMLWMREQLTTEQKQKLQDLIKSREQSETGSGEGSGY
ncbi:MAG: periplasmic heavy metal sensor [Candidatus Margulisiibacteriota bacterium]